MRTVTNGSTVSSRFGRLAMPAAGSPSGGLAGDALDVARLVGVAVLVWGMFASSHPAGPDRRTDFAVAVIVAAVGYGSWIFSRRAESDFMVVGLVLVAVGGGAAAAFGSLGVVFLVILGMATGAQLSMRVAAALVAVSLVSLAVTTAATGGKWEILAWATLAGVGGVMTGANRREFQLRALQSEQLLQERERTEAESLHAAALEERNRIAREIHDVLAHSLGALAVQLETADALLSEGEVERATAVVAESRRLTVEGLDEARRAVHALRDEPVALGDQIGRLAATHSAAFRITGKERPLPADAGLALYRAAQEAVTNSLKHAAGADVSLVLRFGPEHTALSVTDEYPNGAIRQVSPAAGGTGYGLTGMRERVELLGGTVRAGPIGKDDSGWSVEIEIPVHRNGFGAP